MDSIVEVPRIIRSIHIAALQSATRLCDIELAEGNGNDYCQALGQLYDSFTEGLSTADLVEAKNLLDEIE